MTCDKELIVGFIYDDLPAEERRAFEAHLATCAECREEAMGLRATRGHLALWSPPEPEFAFRLLREPVTPKVIPFRSRWRGAFGLAAAAVLVLALATAIANLEVRYDANGFVMRTGWGRGELQAPVASATPTTPGAVPASVAPDFAALERRLRQLELANATQPAAGGVQTVDARMTDGEILRRVREMVAQAEARQETQVAQRLLQIVHDFDQQRRTDLASIQQGIGSYQGLTNAEIAQQRQMLDQLYRVAARQEK